MVGSEDIMNGATVYIDEHECGTVDTSDAQPSANEAQYVSVRMSGRDCREGSSVKIVQTSSAGIAMCGIKVFKDTEFALQ